MIQLEETEFGIRALDHANVEVAVRAPDWRTNGRDVDLDRPTDEVVAGHASELRFSSAYVAAQGQNSGDSFELGSETGPLELPPDDYLLVIGTGLNTYVEFTGTATIYKTEDFDELVISFPTAVPLTLGFRSRHEHPVGTITVPPTATGVATALSHLHSSMKTTGPDRSFPTLRGHPPLVSVGDEIDVPEAVAANTVDTGIELLVPDHLPSLFVVAPLAYYLQASVTVAEVDAPRIEAPAADLSIQLPPLPDLQEATASLLRHVFYLDCLVRNVGPYGTNLAELRALDDTDLDEEWAYNASPPERLAAYQSVPRGIVDEHVPDWHLSTYVAPDVERAPSLPYLLDKMSLIYLPETSELSGSELLERSLDDFYRSTGSRVGARGQHTVASVEVVKPELQRGRVHAWLADGIPIDVFKTTQAAFENRINYLERGGDGIQVVVVLNDEEMEAEHEEVARIYRDRAEDLPMDVTVHEYLERDQLAGIFEAENDFVHYIGHCEESGLRCPDGNLSISDISESNTQTFFLNACGSYYEGMELLEKGSVAGAVTFKEVLNKQAAKVGTAFAQLLVHGFSFARAMQLARRRIMTGKDYAVVGDGTHALTQSEYLFPIHITVEEEAEQFNLSLDVFGAWTNGGLYHLTYADDENTQSYLHGTKSEYQFDREDLLGYFAETTAPVIYDGEFLWTTEVLEMFEN